MTAADFDDGGPVRLGSGGEFDVVRSILRGWEAPHDSVTIPPGDDCVALRGDGVLLSTDLSIEDVHFRRSWLSPDEIGRRACAAALSDLAAMGGDVVGVLLSLAVSAPDVPEVAESVAAGVRAQVEAFGGALLGGDLSRSPSPLLIDIVAVGRAAEPWRRSGARDGDEVWVTGYLGASRAAVAALEAGKEPDPELFRAFASSRPRIAEALWLRERVPVRAAIDLSDGLVGDAGHIAAASGVRLTLDRSSIPVHPAILRNEALDEHVDEAMAGGEDYELMMIAPPGTMDPHRDEFERAFEIPVTRVGVVEKGTGVGERDGRDSESRPIVGGSFTHFAGEDG